LAGELSVKEKVMAGECVKEKSRDGVVCQEVNEKGDVWGRKSVIFLYYFDIYSCFLNI